MPYLQRLIGDEEAEKFPQSITKDPNTTANKIRLAFADKKPQTNFADLDMYVP